MSRKVLIVTGDSGDSYEALYAYHRLLEAEYEPIVAAPSRRRLHMLIHDAEPGWDTYIERQGHSLEADVAIPAVAARDFLAMLILGGRAPEYLRNQTSVLSLVREFAEQGKCIGAIGHGIQILTAAGLTKGRTLTCHPHAQVEVEKDGGTFVSKPAVRDGMLITGQSWRSHPEFYREFFACLNGAAASPPVRTARHLFGRE